MEATVFGIILQVYIVGAFIRSGDSRLSNFNLIPAIPVFVVLLLILPAFHALRLFSRHKTSLVENLRSFDLKQVHCRADFDVNFIMTGISSWYGSQEGFEEYVRGPLADKLCSSVSSSQLPPLYWLLIVTSFLSPNLTAIVATSRSPNCTAEIIWIQILRNFCQVSTSVVVLKLSFHSCGRFSAPASGVWDYVKTTVLVIGLFVLWWGTMFAAASFRRSVEQVLGEVILCAVFLLADFLAFASLFRDRYI